MLPHPAGGAVRTAAEPRARTCGCSDGFFEDPDLAKLLVALLHEALARARAQLPELIAKRGAEVRGRLLPVAVGSADRLGNDAVDDAQAEQIGGGRAHEARRL